MYFAVFNVFVFVRQSMFFIQIIEFFYIVCAMRAWDQSLLLHRVHIKCATKLMAVTSSNLNRFSKFLLPLKEKEISNKSHVLLPTTPYVCCWITFGNLKVQIWCKYGRKYKQKRASLTFAQYQILLLGYRVTEAHVCVCANILPRDATWYPMYETLCIPLFFRLPIVFVILNMAKYVYWSNVVFDDCRAINISCYRNYYVAFDHTADDTDFFYVCRL